jgi:RNA polymerase sigma-70 factor, ECF subfamily
MRAELHFAPTQSPGFSLHASDDDRAPARVRRPVSPMAPALNVPREPAPLALRQRVLFDAHYDFVWRSLRGLGVPPAALDDGAQQVMWLAFEKLDVIIPGSERPFLFRLANGIASNLRRGVRRNREVLDEAAMERHVDRAPGPEEIASHNEARLLLDEALSSLAGDLRMVFVLFELEEMEIPDIAASLEIPVGTVGSRLRRAREKFHLAIKRLRKLQKGTSP